MFVLWLALHFIHKMLIKLCDFTTACSLSTQANTSPQLTIAALPPVVDFVVPCVVVAIIWFGLTEIFVTAAAIHEHSHLSGADICGRK